MNKYDKLQNYLGNKCRRNELLSKHTTLKIGGPATLFFTAETEEELISAFEAASKLKVKYFLLGGGSNLLVSDNGFKGLVIKNDICGIKAFKGKVKVRSGTRLQGFIEFLIENGFVGMEAMIGIPGSVGGAIYGNAGAYGQEVSDNINKLKVFNGEKKIWFSKNACRFGYRNSVFKENGFPILEAEFAFKRGDQKTLKAEAKKILKIRHQKYPDGLKSPGSFFKNVLLKDVSGRAIKMIPEEKIIFGKVPTGYLMEAVGANGKKLGHIQIASYHGNLFINKGGGKAADFYRLANFYGNKVKEKFGIELTPEVQLIGFDKLI